MGRVTPGFLRTAGPGALSLRYKRSGARFALRWRSRSPSAGVCKGPGPAVRRNPGCYAPHAGNRFRCYTRTDSRWQMRYSSKMQEE